MSKTIKTHFLLNRYEGSGTDKRYCVGAVCIGSSLSAHRRVQ